MFDDEMESLFSQFDRNEKKIRKTVKVVNAVYYERAMRIYQNEMRIFVTELIKGTGVTLPSENNNEA